MQRSHFQTSQVSQKSQCSFMLRQVRRNEFEWSANVYCGIPLNRSLLHSDDFHLLTMVLQPGVQNDCGCLPPPIYSINIH